MQVYFLTQGIRFSAKRIGIWCDKIKTDEGEIIEVIVWRHSAVPLQVVLQQECSTGLQYRFPATVNDCTSNIDVRYVQDGNISQATHIVAEDAKSIPDALAGTEIVSVRWLEACLAVHKCLPTEDYQIHPDKGRIESHIRFYLDGKVMVGPITCMSLPQSRNCCFSQD